MARESSLFFLLTSLTSWGSLLAMLGGLTVCLANQRFLPKLGYMSFGFAGLVLSGLWSRVAIPLLTKMGSVGDLIGVLFFIGGTLNFLSWCLLVCGLSMVLADLRQQRPGKDAPLEELF